MATKTDKTAHERGKRFTEKQGNRRMVRVHPWVPEEKVEEVLAYCAELRKQAIRERCPKHGTGGGPCYCDQGEDG